MSQQLLGLKCFGPDVGYIDSGVAPLENKEIDGTPPLLPLVMGGEGSLSLGDGGSIVAGGLVRGFVILGIETCTEFLRCREVLPVVVEIEEADSGCFPLDFDEIEVMFGDESGSFGYQANSYEQPQRTREGIHKLTCS